MKINKKILTCFVSMTILILANVSSVSALEGGYSNGPSKRSNYGEKLNPGFRTTKKNQGFKDAAQKRIENPTENSSSNFSNAAIPPEFIEIQNNYSLEDIDISNVQMPSDSEIMEIINKFNFDENQKKVLFKETKRRLQEMYRK